MIMNFIYFMNKLSCQLKNKSRKVAVFLQSSSIFFCKMASYLKEFLKLLLVKQTLPNDAKIKLSFSVILIVAITVCSLNTVKLSYGAPLEESNSSDSSEEDGMTDMENDFVYSLLHAAMDNLTIRANKIFPTSTPIVMDPLALAPPITLVYNTTYFTSPLGNATNVGTIEDDDFDYGYDNIFLINHANRYKNTYLFYVA